MASRHRNYVFTLNNYNDGHLAAFALLPCRYICYGKEIAPVTGTRHLQGFVSWRTAKTISATRAILSGCHIEVARGTPLQASQYCKKDGDYVERGELPRDPQAAGRDEADRWNLAWDLAKAGSFDEIPADIRIRSYSTLKRIHQDYMPNVMPLPDVCGIWLFGQSGAGKTRSVYEKFPDAFVKPCTKWWDGYQGEEIVVLDDLDKFHVALGGEIKHWADFMPFVGEFKGGSRRIRPTRLIVTSQYRIDEIWQDLQTIEALTRRFVFKVKLLGVPIEWGL